MAGQARLALLGKHTRSRFGPPASLCLLISGSSAAGTKRLNPGPAPAAHKTPTQDDVAAGESYNS